jgi:hypothetical protein
VAKRVDGHELSRRAGPPFLALLFTWVKRVLLWLAVLLGPRPDPSAG